MPARIGLSDTFRAGVLRRLGSWGAKFSADDVNRILTWAEKIIPNRDVRAHVTRLHTAFNSYDSTGQMVRGFFELSPKVRQTFIENLLINWGVVGGSHRYQILEDEGWLPGAFGVISPTMRCNLRCEGCYAFEYRRDGELTTEECDSIITQAKELGMYFFTISGGEPFVRGDLLDMFEKHSDAFFQVYTNGTLIDEEVADRLLELGNVAPAISVEGYMGETDGRRGPGTHERVLSAMKRLDDRGILFGISVTCTKYNHNVLMTDEFFDYYSERGARFAWLFQYIPIGRTPNVDLMPTPEQRTELRYRVRHLRETRSIFIGDFWNDGEYVGGCMAGGRLYFHVTSNGNVEPCVFCHFTVGNIKETPLRDILACDFFRAIRHQQPYGEKVNLYMPCLIIDHPQILRELVREYGARPSHRGAESIVEDPQIVQHLNQYSQELAGITDPEWARDHSENLESEWYKHGTRVKRQWGLEREHLERWYRERHPVRSEEKPVHSEKEEEVQARA